MSEQSLYDAFQDHLSICGMCNGETRDEDGERMNFCDVGRAALMAWGNKDRELRRNAEIADTACPSCGAVWHGRTREGSECFACRTERVADCADDAFASRPMGEL